MSARVNKPLFYLMAIAVLILALSAININVYLLPVKVLGTKTELDYTTFWTDFLAKNPNYIPGWVEMGRADKVEEINPNFIP